MNSSAYLKNCTFNESQDILETADCAICADRLGFKNPVVLLDCGHIFHEACENLNHSVNGVGNNHKCALCRHVGPIASENNHIKFQTFSTEVKKLAWKIPSLCALAYIAQTVGGKIYAACFFCPALVLGLKIPLRTYDISNTAATIASIGILSVVDACTAIASYEETVSPAAIGHYGASGVAMYTVSYVGYKCALYVANNASKVAHIALKALGNSLIKAAEVTGITNVIKWLKGL